jgi:hypothetical protein
LADAKKELDDYNQSLEQEADAESHKHQQAQTEEKEPGVLMTKESSQSTGIDNQTMGKMFGTRRILSTISRASSMQLLSPLFQTVRAYLLIFTSSCLFVVISGLGTLWGQEFVEFSLVVAVFCDT